MTARVHRMAWGGAVLLALGAVTAPSARADPGAAATPPALGRLFMTPAERRALDARRASAVSREEGAPQDMLPAGTTAGRRVVLSGVVRRPGAGPVVWINGRELDPATMARSRVRLRHGPDAENRVVLEEGDEGASARLKPGQAWDPASGSVSDCRDCDVPRTPVTATEPPAASDGQRP